METVRSVFHAQLASVMDTLLAAAVCEIAKIFESSLCEHQAELLQKTNEICTLRSELDKVERRCAESVLKGADVDDKPTSEREHSVKQEPDPVNIVPQDSVTQCQRSPGIKEEAKLYDAVESKPELSDSQSNLELATSQASEMRLNVHQQNPLSSAQSKDEKPHWDGSNLTARQLPDEDDPSPRARSPKVCPDTSRTEEWLPEENTTQESEIGPFHSNEPIWSDLNRQTVFGVDKTLSEDISHTFTSQKSENPASNHGIIQAAQRGEAGLKNYTRHGSTFRSKDRPQSNLHTFALRNMDCLSHRPTGSGVIGRPYTCPYCAKCFAYPSHQRRHLLRHTGVRLHSCQFCDKRFLTPSELTVHTRTHTGERPFACGQCGKRFARSGNLRAHQRDVHLGKRPFACTECGKRFAHKGNLRVHHHRVHQGQRYYQQQPSHMDSDAV